MKRVILESPFGQNPDLYIPYARACIRDSLSKQEAPLASHLLYTQPGVLNDEVAKERDYGIMAGLLWYEVAEGCVVYRDFGISAGMSLGIRTAERFGLEVEYRSLKGVWNRDRKLTRAFPRREVPIEAFPGAGG